MELTEAVETQEPVVGPTETTPPAPAMEETPAEPTEPSTEETAEGEGEKPEPQAASATEKHRRGNGYVRKIERQERQLAEKDAVIAQLLARLPGQPAEPTKDEKTPEQKAEAYLDALLDKRDAVREARRQAEAKRLEFSQRVREARAAHPDFDEVLALSRHVEPSPAVEEAILTSKRSGEIMYELASNPAELERISSLPPHEARRAVWELDAKFASGSTPKTAPKRPAAPAPITPVTARGPTTVKRPEEMSYEEYSAWRDGQRRR